MKRKRLLAGGMMVAVAAAVGTWVSVPESPPCGNKLVQEAQSPDGIRRALLFERSCGGALPTFTHVSIVGPHDKKIAVGGNTFVTEGRSDSTATRIRWSDPRTLIVATAARSSATRTEVWKKGVLVRYEDR
jgi:hypothetical protein